MVHVLHPYPHTGRGLPTTLHQPHSRCHSLAEITGTAGREGQRADVGMAGFKGGPQQHLTLVVHTLGQGPGDRAGSWQGLHSLLTLLAPHGTPTWAQGRERGGGEKREGAMGTNILGPCSQGGG